LGSSRNPYNNNDVSIHQGIGVGKVIIRVEQSGGFANIPKSVEINTNNITKKQACKIAEILKSCSFDHQGLRATPNPSKGAADFFNYKLAIHDDDRITVANYDQLSAPPQIKDLIDYILKIHTAKK
jgi:hypothetical protein